MQLTIFTCDKHGTTISMNDIKVTIPPGAVPEGVVLNIEMGVALYGPFMFSGNNQQVSPIGSVWLVRAIDRSVNMHKCIQPI